MSTPIKIPLLKPVHRQKSSEQSVVVAKTRKMNPIVLLKRLPASFTEQFLTPKIDSNSSLMSKERLPHQVNSSQDISIKPEVFQCLFCIDQSFGSLALLNEHMTGFHRIVNNCPTVTPQKVLSSSQRQTIALDQTKTPENDEYQCPDRASNTYKLSPTNHLNPDQTKTSDSDENQSPDRTTNPTKHQCYICALEFNLQTILSLHLEKVHRVHDVPLEEIVEEIASLPNLEITVMELEENGNSTSKHFLTAQCYLDLYF
jgi:hypothetical protein